MLTERIADYVRGADAEPFADLVRDAFAAHYEHSPPLRVLADAAGLAPGELSDWRQGPMGPTLAFKTQRLTIDEPREEFHSSGTTDGAPSVHHHPYPDLYRTVIDATFPAACLAGLERPPMLSLVPTREQAPKSSLAFMLDHALRRWGGEDSETVARAGGIDATRARGFLAARQRDGRPVVVLATAWAVVQLLEALERLGLAFRLPPGSRLFETGGYKGRSRELSHAELLAALELRLGLPPSAVIREYGMTELTSHFYAAPSPGGDAPFTAPPWVRVRVLDPMTLDEIETGATGLLAVFDLANVGSALHVLTEDLARAVNGGFRLVGRAAGAELRGCSLTIEELATGTR